MNDEEALHDDHFNRFSSIAKVLLQMLLHRHHDFIKARNAALHRACRNLSLACFPGHRRAAARLARRGGRPQTTYLLPVGRASSKQVDHRACLGILYNFGFRVDKKIWTTLCLKWTVLPFLETPKFSKRALRAALQRRMSSRSSPPPAEHAAS